MLTKAIAATALFILMIIIGVLVMIYGWGLEPRSWWWIIGGGVGLRVLVSMVEVITRKQ